MTPSDRPVTLQEIARRAGVSKMTVSLALRGHPHASAATRDRLRALAEEMGYRPNPLVAAAMTQVRAGRRLAFTGTLAFLGSVKEPVLNTALYRAFHGGRRRAEALGYRLEWFWLDPNAQDGRRAGAILTARGIFGVILGLERLLPPEQHLDWTLFAVAAVGRCDVGYDLHRTTADYYRAVREACERCRSHGYRRIGLAITREHHAAHQHLHLSAFLGCQAEWPRGEHVPALIPKRWEAETFLAWIKRHRPEVVIAGFDDPIRWLHSAGLRIPEHIGLIRPHLNVQTPDVAGFHFDDAAIGAAAVDLVVEQLNHNERGLPEMVKRVLLPGRWSEGKSLRSPPGGYTF